jgi:hypothetical protein
MLIFGLFFLRLLFIGVLALLIALAISNHHVRESFSIIGNGIKNALKGCGFTLSKRPYTVELYQWVVMDEEHVCDDGLKRASWPAMDIADWMKAGLPGTPEANTECGTNCSCQLILHKQKNQITKT